MALKIRLRRMGRKKAPHYRIVVAESSMPRDGRFVAKVGHYNPTTNPTTLVVDREKVLEWMAKGAQPTETVANLFRTAGVHTGDPSRIEMFSGAAKKAAGTVAGAVASAATAAAGTAKSVAGAVAERAKDAASAASETAKDAAESVVETVQDVAEVVVERVRGGDEDAAAEAPAAEETVALEAEATEPAAADEKQG